MKLLLIFIFSVAALASNFRQFKGDESSTIFWDEVDPISWMDISNWKDERKFKDEFKQWEQLRRLRRNHELLGRTIDCYGICSLYRGEINYKISYRSQIREGDELTTGPSSFLWLFLLDGTLVRLSPDSSITLKEINLLEKKNFIHARLNKGNLLWLSRTRNFVEKSAMRETEVLFYPLKHHVANPYTKQKNISLDEFLFAENAVLNEQYTRLNKEIAENNKWMDRTSDVFLVMPLVTIYGNNISLEAYSSIGRENYFKLRDSKQLGLEKDVESKVYVNLRGYSNKQTHTPIEGQWYRIKAPARELEPIESNRQLRLNEFVTKRIPSIMIVRENFLNTYSKDLFNKVKNEDLSLKYGYRKWSEESLQKRKKFLLKRTRGLETSNMVIAGRYRQALLKKLDIKEKPIVNEQNYVLPLEKYVQYGEVKKEFYYNPRLNSEKKKLWKKLHGYREKIKAHSGFSKSAPKRTNGMAQDSHGN